MLNSRRLFLILMLLSWSALLFGAGWIARGQLAPRVVPQVMTLPTDYRLLDEVWSRVQESFIGQVPSDTVRNYGAIRGMLATLNDRWTIFVEPQPRAIQRDHLRGQFGGIGVDIRIDEAGRILLTPRRNSPAERAGIQAGDILIGVDGTAITEGMSFEDVAARVRGEVGTLVRITVRRGEQTLEFSITRALIEIPSVEWRVIEGNQAGEATLGYISIRQFTERTGAEARQAIAELREAGSQGYLIDLRDNSGGLLNAAVETASQFLSGGNVLIERKRSPSGEITVTHAVISGGLAQLQPLVVLVNANTASAAEIVAGALQDYNRAPLIGEKTFGKGSVQLVFDFSDGSSAHITAAKWLTPKGRAIDGVGLTPDIEAPRLPHEAQPSVDSQLERAVKALRARLHTNLAP
ncbi:MAG: S41 family peptidase [Anaerolineae bacterium]|nr:S41 family peptidase [Thermoflexales bacterium]MDW8406292.1 S41 family peptidase [Anaerolineae bacterium]